MTENFVSEALATVARDMAAKIKRITEFAEKVEKTLYALEGSGVVLTVTKWDIAYQDAFDVKRSDLPAIRKALGSLSVDGKCAACDFERTNELIVTLKTKAKDLEGIRFRYRTPFRAGGKCHVETQVSTYKTLVCKA